MRTEKLRIGQKGVGNVVVAIQESDTLDELVSLAKGSVEVVNRWATRGRRIELQERTGARDAYIEGKAAGKADEVLTTEIGDLVNNYDPTQKPTRRAAGPKIVSLKAAPGKKLTLDDLRAQLEAQGFKLNIAEEAGATA